MTEVEIMNLLNGVKIDGRNALKRGEWIRVGPSVVLEIVSRGIIPNEDDNAPISMHEMLTELGVPKEGPIRDKATKVVSQVLHRCQDAAASEFENWLTLQEVKRNEGRGAPSKDYARRSGWSNDLVVGYLERWIEDNKKKTIEEAVAKEEKSKKKSNATPRYKGVVCGPMMRQKMRQNGVDLEDFLKENADHIDGEWDKVVLSVNDEGSEA